MRKRVIASCVLVAGLATALPGFAADGSASPHVTAATPRVGSLTRPRLTPETRALLEIQAGLRRQVEVIAKRAGTLPEGPERRELMRRAEALKLQSRVDVLRARAQFARARGDSSTARVCEAKVERLLNPPRPLVNPTTATPKPGAAEGGAQ